MHIKTFTARPKMGMHETNPTFIVSFKVVHPFCLLFPQYFLHIEFHDPFVLHEWWIAWYTVYRYCNDFVAVPLWGVCFGVLSVCPPGVYVPLAEWRRTADCACMWKRGSLRCFNFDVFFETQAHKMRPNRCCFFWSRIYDNTVVPTLLL